MSMVKEGTHRSWQMLMMINPLLISNLESEQMYTLKVNLTDVPQAHIVPVETGNKQQGRQLQFHVVVEIQVFDEVTVSIKSGETTLASRKIALE